MGEYEPSAVEKYALLVTVGSHTLIIVPVLIMKIPLMWK